MSVDKSTQPLTDFEKHIARDLQKVCKDEDNTNPKLSYCQDLVRKHQDAARAEGHRRRQEIASFIFLKFRDSLRASAAGKKNSEAE